MPIATGLALLGSAAIGAAGSAISSHNTNKGIDKATQAQLQAQRENNALFENIYNQNKGFISPFVSRGNDAGAAINALLGLGGPAVAPAPAQPNAFAPYAQNGFSYDPYSAYKAPYTSGYDQISYADPVGATAGAQTNPTPAPTPTAQSAYEQAFKNYQDSTGYRFRLAEGMNALNTGYAASGLLNSGAAQKAILKYGQDYGSNEFGNYMGYLANQQGVGLSGANALAGVGTNYANSVSANNNNAADAISNAALLKAQNRNSLIGSLGGLIGGGLGFSSYGGGFF